MAWLQAARTMHQLLPPVFQNELSNFTICVSDVRRHERPHSDIPNIRDTTGVQNEKCYRNNTSHRPSLRYARDQSNPYRLRYNTARPAASSYNTAMPRHHACHTDTLRTRRKHPLLSVGFHWGLYWVPISAGMTSSGVLCRTSSDVDGWVVLQTLLGLQWCTLKLYPYAGGTKQQGRQPYYRLAYDRAYDRVRHQVSLAPFVSIG